MAASEKKHCQRAVLGAALFAYCAGQGYRVCSPKGAVTALL